MATSSEAFSKFRSVGTVIFVNCRDKSHHKETPAAVLKALGQKQMGNIIPKAVVTSADGSSAIESYSYNQLKGDLRKHVRELKKTLEDVDVVGAAAADPDEESDDEKAEEKSTSLLAPEQEWTNVEGKVMRAAVSGKDAENVMFLMPDGKVIEYSIEKLSKESQEKISDL